MKKRTIHLIESDIEYQAGASSLYETFGFKDKTLLNLFGRVFAEHIADDENSMPDTFLKMLDKGRINSTELVYLAACTINSVSNDVLSSGMCAEREDCDED